MNTAQVEEFLGRKFDPTKSIDAQCTEDELRELSYWSMCENVGLDKDDWKAAWEHIAKFTDGDNVDWIAATQDLMGL